MSGSNNASKHGADQQRSGDTLIELIWIEGRLEHWLRFGNPVGEQIISRRTRILTVRANSVFALVRWASNDFGTVRSRIDIVRAVALGEAYTSLPFVRPGGEILLSIEGWPKVEWVLRIIDAVEAVGIAPAEVAPDHWRHVHNRIVASEEPRCYSLSRHRAFELRRACER